MGLERCRAVTFFSTVKTSRKMTSAAPLPEQTGLVSREIVDVKRELNTLNKDGKEAPVDRVRYGRARNRAGAMSAELGIGIRSISRGRAETRFRTARGTNACFGLGLKLLEEKQFEGKDKPSIVVAGTTQSRIPISLWDKAKGMHLCGKIVFEEGKTASAIITSLTTTAFTCRTIRPPKIARRIWKFSRHSDSATNPGKKGGEATGGKATSKLRRRRRRMPGTLAKTRRKSETKRNASAG